MIELDEGVKVIGNITDCDPSAIAAEMDVTLYFEQPGEDGIRIPNFRTAATGQ
jgi:hypothetical protein